MHGSWLSLVMMLLLVGAALVALAVWFMAIQLLKPPRMTDGKAAWVLRRLSPGDLGLPFEDIAFLVRDEHSGNQLKITGWWIAHPHANGRCVVLIHGYADAKVGAIAWAPMFHALGCNLLVIDLRAHGESGGQYSTAGYFERHDLGQILDRVQTDRALETAQLVLFGVSLGAGVAVAVAAERSDLAGVILECPFPDYRVPAAVHAKLMGVPGGWLQRWAYRLAQRICGADFNAVSPVDLIGRVMCPLMIIQSGADLLFSDADVAPLEIAARARPAGAGTLVYWRVEGAHHIAAMYQDPQGYQKRIAEFLDLAFSSGKQGVPSAQPLKNS